MTWRHKEPGDDGDGSLVVMVAVVVYKTEFLIFRMMIADDLEAQGARASAGKVFTYFLWHILLPALAVLTVFD